MLVQNHPEVGAPRKSAKMSSSEVAWPPACQVLHELHGLKTMRQYLFPDYYPDTHGVFKMGPGEMIGDHMDNALTS